MNTDLTKYKSRIPEYLAARGIVTKQDGSTIRCQCPEPSHADNNPTAILYPETIHCPVCSATWDIFETAGMIEDLQSFPDKLKAVQKALGESPEPSKPEAGEFQAIPYEKAKTLFTTQRFMDISTYVGKGDPAKGYGSEITGAWPFKTESGEVEMIDIRFEGGERKKNVISFYYDGKNVKSRGCPVRICGREQLTEYPDHKVLIVEGCKAQEAAKALIPLGYIPFTWNGGTGKAGKAPWSLLAGRKVVIFPDDDQQLDKQTGELLHPSKQPGIKAALSIQSKIPDSKILKPLEAVRKIKPDGADIVEYLEMFTPEEIAISILDTCENYDPGKPPAVPLAQKIEKQAQKAEERQSHVTLESAPFKILGTANDGNCYFLDRHGRLYDLRLDSISKGKMLQLGSLSYWLSHVGASKMGMDEWTQAQDDLIELGGGVNFDTNNIRGRGAWRDSGDLCFHDGQTTHGSFSPDMVFLKKQQIDIGIGSGSLTKTEIDGMKAACFALSFETNSDAMRLLSWSILAPFSGALNWRPQAFLTGPSGGGKSSVEIHVIKPLALPDRYNAGKTSAAGYMQARKKDSGGVVMDEADPDTETKKRYKEDLLSIMRQSTSDDTPKSAMGTADQTGVTYMTRDMFVFIAISPEIESVADDNRLVKINIKKPDHNGPSWEDIRDNLGRVMTPENCRKIRNMTWESLAQIIQLAEKMAGLIQAHTRKDHRFAISEGTLMAAYITVWKGMLNPTDEDLQEFIAANYEMRIPEASRDEAVEFINRLLEHRVKVDLAKTREYNVMECLRVMKTGAMNTGSDTAVEGVEGCSASEMIAFKRAVNNIGISLDPLDNMAIANNHNEIKRITGRANGYSKMLRRHIDCVDSGKNVVFLDKTRRCTCIQNIVIDGEADDVPF